MQNVFVFNQKWSRCQKMVHLFSISGLACFKCDLEAIGRSQMWKLGESRSGHPCDAETALSAAHAAARVQPITTEFQSWVAWQLSLLQSGCDGLFSTIQVDKSSGLFSRLPVFSLSYKTLQDCLGAFHSRES